MKGENDRHLIYVISFNTYITLSRRRREWAVVCKASGVKISCCSKDWRNDSMPICWCETSTGKGKTDDAGDRGGTTSVGEWGYIITCTSERLSLAKCIEQGPANHCTFLYGPQAEKGFYI